MRSFIGRHSTMCIACLCLYMFITLSISPPQGIAGDAAHWEQPGGPVDAGPAVPGSLPESVADSIIPAPTTLSPSGAVSTHRPTYQWNGATGATRYHLVVYLPEIRKSILQVRLSAGAICSGETCSYTPRVNLTNRRYLFRVRAGDAATWGPFSAWMSFRTAADQSPDSIVIDHTCTDIDRIPSAWLSEARKLAFHLAHTSHGSQIITGLEYWKSQDGLKYNFAVKYDPPGLPPGADRLKIYDGNNLNGDNYITPELYWSTTYGLNRTRSVAGKNLFDYSMWTWCGQQSENDPTTVRQYLRALDGLDDRYSDMRFIEMTGHTDPSSPYLLRNNDIVWNYAIRNGKVLFDFADIERFDPAGNYYPQANDGCPWCQPWCDDHPEDCLDLPSTDEDCAHSHGLMCKVKAAAFWWMMARLAGWDGKSP